MKISSPNEVYQKIKNAEKVTFLTGAGVSTPSGIPDYRSLKGVYHGVEQPEYLLSATCMQREPHKFYTFVQNLYHPEAKPNVIHRTLAALEQEKTVQLVTQNIDGLHEKAGSRHCTNFHGTLYACTCRKCGAAVTWKDYLLSDRHKNCNGQIRPNIVLYEEGFQPEIIEEAIRKVESAELLVILGTSFQVHPFCDLIHYKNPEAEIWAINQTKIYLPVPYHFVQADAQAVFEKFS